jgi:lysophospholipase L1-like esterase
MLQRKSFRKAISLAFICVFIPLLLCEVGSRVWLNSFATPEQRLRYGLYSEISPGEFSWTRHHYLNYYPTPNYKLGLTSHNSLGYRNKEISLHKAQGLYRIVVLGGSTAYTLMVEDNEKTFTEQLEKVLKNTYGYENVEVINAAVGGYDSWESLINLEFRVLDIEPDMVIVYQGADDVHARLVSPEAYVGDNSGRRKKWEIPAIKLYEHSCFLRIISRLLGYTQPININFFVMAPTYEGACSVNYDQKSSDTMANELLRKNPPVYFRRNLLNMAAIAKIHNVELVFATWTYSPYFGEYESTPHYQQGFSDNNKVLKEVADSQNIPFFDFAKVMSNERRYWADGRHVNEEGALLKAELFAEFIHRSGLISLKNQDD